MVGRSLARCAVALAIVLVGMSSPSTSRAAISKLPDDVAVVYLPGTAEASNVTPKGLQDQTRWLHRRLIRDLGASHAKAFTVNYYTTQSLGGGSTSGIEVPEVRSVLGFASGKSTCLGKISAGVDEGNVLRHAYHTAWALSAQSATTPSRRYLFIGHSQGAAIARIVWILSDTTRRNALASKLSSDLRPDCWPTNITPGSIYGHVYMGAPMSGAPVPLFDTAMKTVCTSLVGLNASVSEMCQIVRSHLLQDNAHSILQSTSAVAPRSVAFGGWRSELFNILGRDLPLIPWQLTAKNKVQKNIVVIPSNNGSLPMAHEHWWNPIGVYSGYCPKWLKFDTREYCGWSDAFTDTSTGAKPIFVVGASGWTLPKGSGDPGDIYDLIIMRMKLDWT
jgi:hypothetical protein